MRYCAIKPYSGAALALPVYDVLQEAGAEHGVLQFQL